MGRYITGKIRCEIHFYDLYVDDDETEIDAIFPDGWEGEMLDETIDIQSECDEEEEDEEDEEE